MDKAIEWAWLAGFVEGEGTFQVRLERREHIYPALVASGVDRLLLDKCRTIAGGFVYGPIGRGDPRWRPAYRWQLRASEMATAIEGMLPYLLVKREQAEICLLLRRATILGSVKGHFGRPVLTDDFKQWRLQLRQAVMALNRRGTVPLSQAEAEAIAFARSQLTASESEIPYPFQSATWP